MAELWIFVALAFLVGALAGLGAAALQRRRGGNDGDLEALREEFEAYREDVTTHFVQTADLINNLTQSYKAVYDHLERGAFALVGEERLREELEAVEAEPVMLEYLGKQGSKQGTRPANTPAPIPAATQQPHATPPETSPASDTTSLQNDEPAATPGSTPDETSPAESESGPDEPATPRRA
ncbi:MAG TPA: DUF1043 family protein [Trueperaceae bacterium]